jgi:hypothetical protein
VYPLAYNDGEGEIMSLDPMNLMLVLAAALAGGIATREARDYWCTRRRILTGAHLS